MDTLGFVELSSIASGIEIADAMLKTANINVIFAKASCPGKYYVLVNGQVANVQKAVKVASDIAGGFFVSSLVLPKVHPKVITAVNMSGVIPDKIDAIGVMEFFSVTSSIVAADAAVKAATVELIDVRLGTGIGGKSFVVISGDTSSVKTAVAAATSDKDDGMLVNKVVITKPDKKLLLNLF
jgi:microcompartment protein CcmL/EutN